MSKACKYCNAPPYKDSEPCTNEQEAKDCQELAGKLKNIWEESSHE